MFEKSVHRLTVALALVAVLALAVPPPASASGSGRPEGSVLVPGWVEMACAWLGGLWEELTAAWAASGIETDPNGTPRAGSADQGNSAKRDGTGSPSGDSGIETDPNG